MFVSWGQGLTYDEHSLLADRDLRAHLGPISATHMDFMHNFLVNGVANTEVFLFMARGKAQMGLRFADMLEFVTAAWEFPVWQSSHKAVPEFTAMLQRTSPEQLFP